MQKLQFRYVWQLIVRMNAITRCVDRSGNGAATSDLSFSTPERKDSAGTMQPSDSKFRTLIDLLDRNMSNYGEKPAYREKEFGIWQSWTWFDAANEIESLALGLIKLGAKEGDKIAVAGRNRPALYWSILAIQSIGSIPVPVYQEAVADEMAYVLAHSGARFAIAGDQEQVDKILDQQEQLPELEGLVYLDPKGLRRYDKDRLHSFKQLQIDGRADEAALKPELKRRREAVGGATPCVILYTSGTTGRPKGVVLSHANIIAASKASCEFDSLTPRRHRPRLPSNGLGRGFHLFDRAGLLDGLLRELPRVGGYDDGRSAGNRPDVFLCPAAHIRDAADQGEYSNGGREPTETMAVQLLHESRSIGRPDDDVRRRHRVSSQNAVCPRRYDHLRTASECYGVFEGTGRIHRGGSHWSGNLHVFQVDQAESEAALTVRLKHPYS